MPRLYVRDLPYTVFGLPRPRQMLGKGMTSIVYEHPEESEKVIMFTLDALKLEFMRHINLIESFEDVGETRRYRVWNARKGEYALSDHEIVYAAILPRMNPVRRGSPFYRAVKRESDAAWNRQVYYASGSAAGRWGLWQYIYSLPEEFPTLHVLADWIINYAGVDMYMDARPNQWFYRPEDETPLPLDAALSVEVYVNIWKKARTA